MSQEILTLTRALDYAARAHCNQRRKGPAQEPYVNHLIEVMDLIARATGGQDSDLLAAALLHDVIEDCGVSEGDLALAFGVRVAAIVAANSDDMSLPKPERKARRIAEMPKKSPEARMVKTADVISNLRAIVLSAPAGWTVDWKLGYVAGCRQLIDAGRGANATLEGWFDETAAEVERALREGRGMDVEGRAEAVRQLESEIGQPVHLVYLPNCAARALTDSDAEWFGEAIGRLFASVTVQKAQGRFDGRQRPILIARVRSDDTGAVVALAQRLCLDFDERFIGIEVGGRYIRVYSDDTG